MCWVGVFCEVGVIYVPWVVGARVWFGFICGWHLGCGFGDFAVFVGWVVGFLGWVFAG